MPRAMKESGIEWLGEMPVAWQLSKINTLYNPRKTKVNDRDFPPLSVTKKGVVPQLDTAAKTNAHDDRKLVKAGDFVINSRSDRKGSCGISNLDGSVSLINIVLSPQDKMIPKYYNWLFQTNQFADEFYKWGHGIVDDLWTTTWQEMKNIEIPVPSLFEQKQIANFLDHKCDEIDALHADIEKQIATLEDYKKSVITEAVTKGLNPDVEMKDTNIVEIDILPKHWAYKKVKYICSSLTKGNGITKEQVYDDGDIQCIRYGEIYSKYNNQVNTTHSKTKLYNLSSPKFIYAGDILFAGTGELVEEIGKNIVYLSNEPCLAGGDIIVMSHTQNARFLNYSLNSTPAQQQKSKGKAKLKVVHISANNIGNIKIPLPPIEEQQEIADYLDQKTTEIDAIISAKKQQLDILDNYKKSLIYEYVTGKKEVPSYANAE